MNDVILAFRQSLRYGGSNYTRQRPDNQDLEIRGVKNTEEITSRKYIGFTPGSDVVPGDVLVNLLGERLYVIDVSTDIIQDTPFQLKAYYLTEQEHKAKEQTAGTVFNIQNAYGSVIGNGNTATIHYSEAVERIRERVREELSEDKEDMEKIVNLLEMIVNNQIPVSKGLFSRFSDVMERHSWLSGSIAGAVFSWLTTLPS